MSIKILSISILVLLSCNAIAAKTELPVPDFKNLNLDKYLNSDSKSISIKSFDPNSVGKNGYHIVSSKDESGKDILKMHLFDFDNDGKIDLVKHFENGKVLRSEWNLDRDALAETVKYYDEKGSINIKVDTDGKVLFWSHYFKGDLRLKEIDRNGDKVPDMWQYYQAGKLVKVEAAKNFDPSKREEISKDLIK